VFVPESALNRVQIWEEGSMTPIRNISAGLTSPFAVFASITGDVYVDNGWYNGRVDKWTSNATNSVTAMYVIGACYSLFVDIYGNLYCTISDSNIVVKKLFGDDANTTQIVAGNGSAGSTPNMLNIPRGIFVDLNFNLYVADCNNDRILLFQPGQLNATTIIGNGSSGITTIRFPMAIMIDADGYFFILEFFNTRIVRVGPNSSACIAACTLRIGSAANQLNYPWSFSFDSYGNIFVVDRGNSRIQKFLFNNDSCGKFYVNRNDD
jgi:tripartite motif-containing protein 71